ncbi:MAG TPA: hypothetical protein DCE41_21375 [Cytophagales bacterium]|nr:hypothetical protein [Cytophagales bacterium]HAA20672.1 hypothetical protein [Cytophagales bacterium]HAP64146.1 hypothetical protein [Cytophagales bacterium]
MLNLFKRQRSKGNKLPALQDLDKNPLQEGDVVEALRYNLGKSRLLVIDEAYVYESLDTGEQVHYTRMIDAITECQKVKKLTDFSE